MLEQSKIGLECPYCDTIIYRPINWFRQPYVTCPDCGQGISSAQFSAVIHDLEAEIDRNIDEMLQPERTGCSCGGDRKGCA